MSSQINISDKSTNYILEQLEQIKRSNLARIFCDNSNNVQWMQKDVFLVPDESS